MKTIFRSPGTPLNRASDYDPELRVRIGLGITQNTYVQLSRGKAFYLLVFRCADGPVNVYLESGYAEWLPNNQNEDTDNERMG